METDQGTDQGQVADGGEEGSQSEPSGAEPEPQVDVLAPFMGEDGNYDVDKVSGALKGLLEREAELEQAYADAQAKLARYSQPQQPQTQTAQQQAQPQTQTQKRDYSQLQLPEDYAGTLTNPDVQLFALLVDEITSAQIDNRFKNLQTQAQQEATIAEQHQINERQGVWETRVGSRWNYLKKLQPEVAQYEAAVKAELDIDPVFNEIHSKHLAGDQNLLTPEATDTLLRNAVTRVQQKQTQTIEALARKIAANQGAANLSRTSEDVREQKLPTTEDPSLEGWV